jgi:glycosidase
MNKRLGFFIVLVLLLLAACGQAAKSIPPAPPNPTQALSTSTQTSSAPTQTATLLPSPTNTIMPSATPIVVGPVVGGPAGTDGYPWWNDTVFYEIFVRSFFDGNNNGTGDFNGVTEKLDYLKDLGISGIYLLPIHPSTTPVGYNAIDFYSVNPDYGTMDDFKRLLSEAHKRGIRIIIDRAVYNTSTQNPWFIAAQDPNSPYRDWYYWSTTDKGISIWGTPAWFKTPTGYYFSAFSQDYPFLNLKNPAVTAESYKVSQFWLQDVGVDGFRVDSAAGLIPEGRTLSDTPSTHAWLKSFYTFYKGINPNAFTVGEAWKEPASSLATYTGDQVDTTFEFNIAGAIIDSVQSGNNSKINSALQKAIKFIPRQQFDPFITNHDMDREMTVLKNDTGKAKAAASLLLTSPGVPFIYFGEEIGMQGQYKDANGNWLVQNTDDPMQWSSDKNAGFTTGSPWFQIDPSYVQVNVSAELKDPASLLSHYKALISLRNAHPALRIGSFNIVSSGNPGLFASLRVSSNEATLVLINLTNAPLNNISLSLDKSPLQPGNYSALPLMGQGSFGDLDVSSTGGFSNYGPIPTIPAYETVILQITTK